MLQVLLLLTVANNSNGYDFLDVRYIRVFWAHLFFNKKLFVTNLFYLLFEK